MGQGGTPNFQQIRSDREGSGGPPGEDREVRGPMVPAQDPP